MQPPRIYTLDALMSVRDTRPPVLMNELLYAKTKLVIGGPAKSHKTFFLHTMLYALATGQPFLDLGLFDVPKPQPGLLISQELARFGLSKRWAYLLRLDKADTLKRNVMVAPHHPAYRLDTNDDAVARAIETAQATLGLKLGWLALDPISKFHNLAENDESAVRKLLERIDRYNEEYDLATIYVHHHGHHSEDRELYRPPEGLLRGSSLWAGDADTVLTLRRERPNEADDGRRILSFTLRQDEQLRDADVRFNHRSRMFEHRTWIERIVSRDNRGRLQVTVVDTALPRETYDDD